MCTQINASINHHARRKHMLWLRLRSYLVHCNVKRKELVPPRLLSARQNSFFSLQTPESQGTGQQEPRTAHSRETQTGDTAQKQRNGNCFTCPRWHCSLVLFRTPDTTPLSRCLNWETRFQVSNEQPSFKGCQNDSKLLWYTNHLVTKNVRNISKSSQVKLVLIQTQATS